MIKLRVHECRLMIEFTAAGGQEPAWKGYFYSVLLFVVTVVTTLLLHYYWHRCFRLGMVARSAIVATVYNKVGVLVVCVYF